MMVYKYVIPERIDVIENGRIRFTQAAALNDPFEMYPCFNLFNESLKEHFRNLLKREPERFNVREAVLGEFMLPKMVSAHTLKFQRDLGNRYPMLSLTKKRNNLLMWSHYAYAYRGFVIGFDSDSPFFHKEKPRRMSPLFEVKYSNKRLVLPRFEECKTEEIHEQILLIKSEHWSYEEELRMFAKPNAADVVLKGNDGLPIYLFKFPPECIREIIFGRLMKRRLMRKISDIAKRLYPNAELFEARLNETSFDLDVIPFQR